MSATSPCRPRSASQVEEIDRALLKFDAGTYGICEVSGTADPEGAPQGDPVGPRAGRVQGRRVRAALSSTPSSPAVGSRHRRTHPSRAPAGTHRVLFGVVAVGWLLLDQLSK